MCSSAYKNDQKLFWGENSLCDRSFEDDAIPKLLKGLPSLECLDLASNKLSDLAKGYLMKFSGNSIARLTHLDISHNLVSSAGMESLSKALVSNSNLKYLNVGGNPLGDEGTQFLSQALPESCLTYLNVSETEMTDEGLVLLASTLQSSPHLNTIILRSNDAITFEGLGFLLEMTVNSQLCEIDASHCEIEYRDGLSDVFKNVIATSTTLKSLNLSYNNLADEGVLGLIHSVSSDTQLTKLAFGGNSMSPLSLQALACILCEETSLNKISLNEEDLFCDTDTFDPFCECLVACSSLQEIHVFAVDNEKTLRKAFRTVNIQRELFEKNQLKFYYFEEFNFS